MSILGCEDLFVNQHNLAIAILSLCWWFWESPPEKFRSYSAMYSEQPRVRVTEHSSRVLIFLDAWLLVEMISQRELTVPMLSWCYHEPTTKDFHSYPPAYSECSRPIVTEQISVHLDIAGWMVTARNHWMQASLSKESTESMFLWVITKFPVLAKSMISRANFESTTQFSISTVSGMFKSISRTFVLMIGSRSIIGSEITIGAPMVPRRAIFLYNSLIYNVYMAARTRLSAKLFCLHFRFLDVANPD